MVLKAQGYSGQGFSPRGEKARYVLPPAFRNAIAPGKDDTRTLCLVKHDRWNCLAGFGLARTESFEAQLDREENNAVKLGKEKLPITPILAYRLLDQTKERS